MFKSLRLNKNGGPIAVPKGFISLVYDKTLGRIIAKDSTGIVPFVGGAPAGTDVRGNVAVVLTPTSKGVQSFETTLTAARAITFSGTFQTGHRFRIVRLASGAYDLTVAGLAIKATNQWAEVEYNGSAWKVIALGVLTYPS